MDAIIKQDGISNRIYVIRNMPVMLDSDLAELYGVETKVLNQAVSRNKNRFPEDFRFQLATEDLDHLRSQIVTSSLMPRMIVSSFWMICMCIILVLR